jgi:aryl sulfotransferase
MLPRITPGDMTMLDRAPVREIRDFYCDSRQWDAYRPREGDVVIATAPKVGTTWTQQIVSLLVFQNVEPRPLMMMSPWIDCRIQMPPEMMIQIIEAQTHRRFLKSHLPMDGLPIYGEVRYIHVARGGRDACMSFLNHINGYNDDAWGRLDAVGLADPDIGTAKPRPPRTAREFYHHWIKPKPTGALEMMSQSFFGIERSYWKERARPNVLLVHYNDLKADLAGEMARIASFLGIEVPDALWPDLVDAATFESMQRDGESLLPGMEVAFNGGVKTFLNKGTNNRWQGVLTPEDNALYEERTAQELTPGLRNWLEAGRLVAGDPRRLAD